MDTTKTQYTQQKYKIKHQLLINSLGIGGLGFVIVGLLSLAYSMLMTKYFETIIISNNYLIGASLTTLIFFIIAIVLNFKWNTNILDSGWGLISSVWIINIISLTGILAPLITMIQNSWLIFTTISVTGGIFALMGLIGYCFMSAKSIITITNFIWIMLGIMFLFQLVFTLTFSFLYTNSFSIYYLVFNFGYMLISILMVGMMFWSINRSSDLYNELDRTRKTKLSLFFGMQLMMLFVIIFLYVLRFFLAFKE